MSLTYSARGSANSVVASHFALPRDFDTSCQQHDQFSIYNSRSAVSLTRQHFQLDTKHQLAPAEDLALYLTTTSGDLTVIKVSQQLGTPSKWKFLISCFCKGIQWCAFRFLSSRWKAGCATAVAPLKFLTNTIALLFREWKTTVINPSKRKRFICKTLKNN